jgi:hypothetical protein
MASGNKARVNQVQHDYLAAIWLPIPFPLVAVPVSGNLIADHPSPAG